MVRVVVRIVWLVVLVACISGACWVPLTAWQQLQRRPTVLSMERDYTSWNTSFPAVTLCPETKVDPVALQVVSSRLLYKYECLFVSGYLSLKACPH